LKIHFNIILPSSSPFFNISVRCRWMAYAMHQRLYPRERDPLPIAQEAVWAPELVWTER
jgi:hypothetical protein